MSEDDQKARDQRFKDRMSREFQPLAANTPSTPEHRIAHSLEYIAFQLGQINRKLDRISGGFPNPPKPRP